MTGSPSRLRTALLGSKRVGLEVLAALKEKSDVVAAVTVDDSDDTRSVLPHLLNAGAAVDDAERVVKASRPDVVLVAGWYRILSPELLATTRFLGIHHSPLPRYRGSSPLVWQLIRGEPDVGTTLFELSGDLDAGRIWGQSTIRVGPDDYVADVLTKCDAAGVALVNTFLDGRAEPREQVGNPSWCAPRRPDDGLIDWSRPAAEVLRWIRAQSRPYPGAFTYLDGERLTIWRARLVDKTYIGTPGQLLGSLVVCGDDRALEIEEASRPTPRFARFGHASH